MLFSLCVCVTETCRHVHHSTPYDACKTALFCSVPHTHTHTASAPSLPLPLCFAVISSEPISVYSCIALLTGRCIIFLWSYIVNYLRDWLQQTRPPKKWLNELDFIFDHMFTSSLHMISSGQKMPVFTPQRVTSGKFVCFCVWVWERLLMIIIINVMGVEFLAAWCGCIKCVLLTQFFPPCVKLSWTF